ncbi:hypothetical protein M885DRAFT_618073 [Pelagophyceae sp. CCMP2097]|nr:hypothetical protein M885DRAFT_618073 [Pelagophyceae sp. CCMP2097]
MQSLGGETLQERLKRIGDAAKRRNPNGFVDVNARRNKPLAAEAPPAEAARLLDRRDGVTEWLCARPTTALECALARGDAEAAQDARSEAQRRLERSAADGSLDVSLARDLVRDGACCRVLLCKDAVDAMLLRCGDDGSLFAELAKLWDRADVLLRCTRLENERDAAVDGKARAAKAAGDLVSALEAELVKTYQQRVETAAEHAAAAQNSTPPPAAPPLQRAAEDVAGGAAKSSARALLRRIRTERLVDCEAELALASPAVRNDAAALQRSLAAAAKRIATDLYASPTTQFISEVVQNADDADSSNTEPRLELGLLRLGGGWVFYAASNQVAMNAENVIALSDVNRSTKTGEQSTGHKGIGFKSCFAASGRPTVLSGEFALCFDVDRDGELGTFFCLGLVTPRWVDDVSALPDARDATVADAVSEALKKLGGEASSEGDGAPPAEGILVFTKRLRRLTITVDGTVDLLRADVMRDGHRAVELRCAIDSTERQRVETRHYRVWRDEARAVEICFADSPFRPALAHVVLPVATLGAFGFSVNAGLDVAASRDAIRTTSPRNLLLRQAVADAFLRAVAQDDELRALEYVDVANIYTADAFWLACRDDILDRGLRRVECVSTGDGAFVSLALDKCFRPPSDAVVNLVYDLLLKAGAVRVPQGDVVYVVTPAAPKTARAFALPNLGKCFFDVVCRALLAASPELWPRIRKLRIIPAALSDAYLALDDANALNVFADGVSVDVQGFGPIACGDALAFGIVAVSEPKTFAARKSLEAHGAALPPALQENAGIEWEAFFADVLVAAGLNLNRADFWRKLSPRALTYLQDRLGRPGELEDARSLPFVSAAGFDASSSPAVLRLDELFVRHIFALLCGSRLPYAFADVADPRRDGFPDVVSANCAAQCALIKRVFVGELDVRGCAAAIKALSRRLRDDDAFAAFAALYRAVSPNLAALLGQDARLVAAPFDKAGKNDCVWDDDAVLCGLAGVARLAPVYARYEMRHIFLGVGVEQKLGKVHDFVGVLDAIASDSTKAAALPLDERWRLVVDMMKRLAAEARGNGSDAIQNAFISKRLIVIRRVSHGSEESTQLIALSVLEAFWAVPAALQGTLAPKCALDKHFPTDLNWFFVDF